MRVWRAGVVMLAAVSVQAAAFPAGQGSAPPSLDIREHVFDNGLRLLVLERPGDPRVACKIFFDMGAVNEIPGEAGAAHFLEHLLFKGTRTLGTTDWEAEAPLRQGMDAAEAELIEALNAARNDIQERGVFHDYRHADSTRRIDAARARIAEIEARAQALRDHGAMMRWYQAYGGTYLTATTEQEYMKFDINLPAERVDLFVRVEADRMQNTVFREFDEERMILVEQRLGDLNRATTPYYEQMAAASGASHPVFWPEGHYPQDFAQYTRAWERELYERYFVVNNTTLVFVGGVTLQEMIPRVQHFFGHMQAAPEAMRVKATEPVPMAERRVHVRSAALSPRVEMRHMIPGVGHPDRPHFDVLAEVAPAVIEQALAQRHVEGRVDVNTRVIHTSRFGVPSTLNFEVVLHDDADIAAAEAALTDAIGWLAAGKMTAGDMAAAKKRLRTDWYRTAGNADELAFEIGHFQMMDRWQTLQAHMQAREMTTVAQIAELARRYLIHENRIVGVVSAPADVATEAGR